MAEQKILKKYYETSARVELKWLQYDMDYANAVHKYDILPYSVKQLIGNSTPCTNTMM